MNEPNASRARIAVIGAGWWSTYTHIPAIQAHPGAELAALCDADPARLQAAAAAFGVERTYSRLDDMLDAELLNGVIIATPHATHARLAQTCLERGLNVLVEKPMTLVAAEAGGLVALAQQNGCQLIVGYPWHYTARVRRARELVRSGALGPVEYVVCSMTSDIAGLLRGDDRALGEAAMPVHGPGAVYSNPALSGGGEGHLQITHTAGLMFFVSGLRAERVSAFMNTHGLTLDLVDAMAVGYEGGALGVVGGSGNSRHHSGKLELRCQRGGLLLDMDEDRLVIYDAAGQPETIGLEPGEETYPRFATAQNLVDVCLGQAINGSPGEYGWRTVELLEAAYRSARADGQPVWIKDLYK